MKRALIIAFMLLGSISLCAQRHIGWQTGIYGGANLEEGSPDLGVYISLDAYNIRSELDIGWGNFRNDGHNFLYVSPMIGAYIGHDLKCFCLIGITNWGGILNQNNEFKSTSIMPKVKMGGEIPLAPYLCFSVYWSYILPIHTETLTACKYNATMVSLGFKF